LKVFRNNLQILCHPICNRLYITQTWWSYTIKTSIELQPVSEKSFRDSNFWNTQKILARRNFFHNEKFSPPKSRPKNRETRFFFGGVIGDKKQIVHQLLCIRSQRRSDLKIFGSPDSPSFPGNSFEWRGLRLLTFKIFGTPAKTCLICTGIPMKNLLGILAVVITLSPISWVCGMCYGVATISRLLRIIGLFCKRALYKRRYSAKETEILRSLLIVATPYGTARSWKDETRYGHWNGKRNPRWSSQVSFQMAHWKRDLNFDYPMRLDMVHLETRHRHQNGDQNSEWSSQVSWCDANESCHTYEWVVSHEWVVCHTATHCNTLQHTATHCNTLFQMNGSCHMNGSCVTWMGHVTHCDTLQHTATHCNTLQHTATRCNTLRQMNGSCVTWMGHVSHEWVMPPESRMVITGPFQTAHSKNNLDFDHTEFRFVFRWQFRVTSFRERAVQSGEDE